MKKIRILWDFDGTIFDTYPYIVKSFIEASGEDLDEEEVLKCLKQNSRVAFQHFKIEENKQKDFYKRDMDYSMEHSKPFFGIENVLTKAKQNIIVTHRDRESTEFLLKKFKLERYFDAIISVEEDGFERKPSVESYKFALEEYGVDLVVGDRTLDLQPAREIGVQTVAFQNLEIQADYHIADYNMFWSTVKLIHKKDKE